MVLDGCKRRPGLEERRFGFRWSVTLSKLETALSLHAPSLGFSGTESAKVRREARNL